MIITTLSKKGQIVIPVRIRHEHGLKQGDRFLVKEEGGKIILEPLERHPFLRLRGTLRGEADLTKTLLKERLSERARENGGKVSSFASPDQQDNR